MKIFKISQIEPQVPNNKPGEHQDWPPHVAQAFETASRLNEEIQSLRSHLRDLEKQQLEASNIVRKFLNERYPNEPKFQAFE